MKRKIVDTVARKCLGYKRGEEFLVVCDDKKSYLGRKFYEIARSLDVTASLLEMPARKTHGEEPPGAVREALKEVDCAVLITSASLSHTKARKRACHEYGTRIASLPSVTEEVLKRSILLDYNNMKRKVKKAADLLTKAGTLEVYTDKGTHLVMSVKGRKGFTDNGLYTKKGAFGNLPAGEACIAPVEGTAEGRLVADGSMPLTGRIKKPVEVTIKKGFAVKAPVPKMRPLVKKLGKKALNVAELGIGLNPKAKVTGVVLEDEKSLDTAHLALGNNLSFGGNVYCPLHLDLVFFDPVILLDGKKLDV